MKNCLAEFAFIVSDSPASSFSFCMLWSDSPMTLLSFEAGSFDRCVSACITIFESP